MHIVIRPSSGIPVFRQIEEQIRFLAVSGALAPGEEVPSTRALSAQLGVNPMTVSKAYGALERTGVLERRPGRPLVVRARAAAESEREQLDEVRECLAPAAGKIRKLDVTTDQALAVLRALLTADQEDA